MLPRVGLTQNGMKRPLNDATQVWYLPRYDKSCRPSVRTTVAAGSDVNLPLRIQSKLSIGDSQLYDFYSSVDDPRRPLQFYREKQQDVCQYSHDLPLAATDGSLSLRKERMGTSFVLVEKPGYVVSLQFSAPVGGPLATLRAEAVCLLYLLCRVKAQFELAMPLLVCIDFLVLLQILQKWGQSDFWPDPHDIIHFDVIFPLLQELH